MNNRKSAKSRHPCESVTTWKSRLAWERPGPVVEESDSHMAYFFLLETFARIEDLCPG